MPKPALYTLSAFWAGQEGSLLFWLWMLALLTGLIALRPAASAQRRRPYLLADVAGLQAFPLLVQIVVSNPFATQATFPADGQGLNPLLQNFWMIVHPPVVFIGYALYAIPFALVIAALWSGELDAGSGARPAPLEPVGLVIPGHGHPVGRMVGLCGAGLGRLLGLVRRQVGGFGANRVGRMRFRRYAANSHDMHGSNPS